jgi:hypothetical protein
MAFTESLTVRILGDSSQLRDELQSVADELRGLQGRLQGLTNVGEQIGRGLGRVDSAVRPLETVSRLLAQITTQAQALSREPIRLNVQPALAALQQLSQAIQAIAAQLRALALPPIAFGPAPGAGGGGGPIRSFDDGGLVSGRSGVDAVPAVLTAGEFVLSRQATQALGLSLLQGLNSGQRSRSVTQLVRETRVNAGTTNHFGGITINVARPGNVNEVVRDLRLHGVRLRNRRG